MRHAITSPPRPIRVMRIIARLNVGGPALHVAILTERLGPPDFESLLVCGHVGPHEGDMAYLLDERGITPRYIPQLGRALSPWRDVMTLVKLWRLMRRWQPDVVHTHTAKAGFVGRVAAWLAGVPVRVHTFHGHVFRGYFGPLQTRLFLALERLAARLSDRLITISPQLRDELVEMYRVARAEKFAVIPLGLELRPYLETPRGQGAFRARYGIPAEAPLIGIVGRLVPIKNHALFLAMAARLRQRLPEARFVIVGDGELRATLEAQARALGLAGAVRFSGFLRDLRPVYSDLDVLVIASDNEGTPVSIIEALAAGVPVAATAVGGVPDLLRGGERGQLAPAGDADALSEAVLAALQTHNLTRQEALRQEIAAEYGAQRLARDLATLYRQLLREKGRLP